MSEQLGVTVWSTEEIADAFQRVRQREAQREQEYRDAIAEAESNVIQFRPRSK
jgi:hypothetical protein